VQSFGYRRYLPLGKPEVLVENLDRWGADEILLQCIDRSRTGDGPDLALLERVSRKGLATPLIYAGGIRDADDAVAAVKSGADRICVDAMLHDAPHRLAELSEPLGAQAIIASLPMALAADEPLWTDYRSGRQAPLGKAMVEAFETGVVSEALVIDWQHEGSPGAFDNRLLTAFPARHIPLIAFGGLSMPMQLREALQLPRTSAVAVGNFLNYREHGIAYYKSQLAGLPVRLGGAEARP
jgi:cyclase